MPTVSRKSAIPPVPPGIPVDLRPLLSALREAVQVQAGHGRGDKLDSAVTFRDLEGVSGVFSQFVSSRAFANAVGSHVGGIANPGVETPTAPTGVTFSVTYISVAITWTIPLYGGHHATRVYRTPWNGVTLPGFNEAFYLGSSFSTSYFDTSIQSNTKYVYWVRHENLLGAFGPPHDPLGTQVQSLVPLDEIMDVIGGNIEKTHLATALQTELTTLGDGVEEFSNFEVDYYAQWGVKTSVAGLQGGVGFYNDGVTTQWLMDAGSMSLYNSVEGEVIPFFSVVTPGGSTPELPAGLYLDGTIYVQSANVVGTLTANALVAGSTVTSPLINGGTINGAHLTAGGNTASQILAGSPGVYIDGTTGYLTASGASLRDITIYSDDGSVILSSDGSGSNSGGVTLASLGYTGDPDATNGAPAGTFVAGVSADVLATVATNFNAANDRNSAAIAAPTIATDGTAIDHTLQVDGSADISFEWSWGGSEGDIDGFLVTVYQSGSANAYVLGSSPALETVYTVPASKRAFILFGTAADRYYTFGVQAYRSVDKSVAASGTILSARVKSTAAGENPFRPSATVAFVGNVTGTINSIPAANVNVWTAISGTGKPADGATVGAPAGTLVAGVSADAIASAVTDFNAGNNRNASAIAAPTLSTTGAAVDHTLQTDGSADVSFEWVWGGNNADIDGFLIHVAKRTASGAYTLGTTPSEETVYTVPATARAFIIYGTAANSYYTIGVQAYRSVDKDVNAAGVIKSTLVKSTASGENPYRPSATVAFTGDVQGTINGSTAGALASVSWIDTVNWSTYIAAAVVDNMLVGRVNVVDTLQIKGQAVTIPLSAYTGSSVTLTTTYVDIQSISVSAGAGVPFSLLFSCIVILTSNASAGGSASSTLQLRLLADSTVLADFGDVAKADSYSGGAGSATHSASFSIKHTPTLSTVTYKVQAKVGGDAAGRTGYASQRGLIAIGTKR